MKATRSHDYAYLVERWQELTQRMGWRMASYAREADEDLWVAETPGRAGPALYFSAGIHGDEPAATEALWLWAERNATRLSACSVVFFPCLNPWGLRGNGRLDYAGRDLNRCYNDLDCALVQQQLACIAGRHFDAAAMLHEDYDGTGFYLYEIASGVSWGPTLVAAAAPWVGVEARREIDGVLADSGVVQREIGPEILELMPKHPEALYLAMNQTRRCYTLETPSEDCLDDRIEAHVAVLNKLLDLLKVA